MVNPNIDIFNWFRRYRVRAQDMTLLQTSLIELTRGPWEGETGAAVLDGFLPESSGLDVEFSPGVALSPSGFLLSITGTTEVTLASPAGNPARSLIVARPVILEENPITRPTSPFDIVYLNQALQAEIVVLDGTAAANPAYPATEPGDVILAAYRLPAGAASVTDDNLDTDQRNDFGRNGGPISLLARGDERCRPERASASTITVKPSQTGNGLTKLFSYAGAAKPLIFPKTGGAFTDQDTTLNFLTGAITGGDGDSSNFTPQIPTAGNFIWALVTLTSLSLVEVAYGTTGTYAQCKAALKDQDSVGAGAVPVSTNFKVAFVLLGSSDGVNITELELVDARGPGNTASAGGVAITSLTSADSPYTMDGTERHIEVDASGGAVAITLPDRATNEGTNYPIDRIDAASGNAVTLNRAGSDTFAEPVNTLSYPVLPYEAYDIFAGATKWKVR